MRDYSWRVQICYGAMLSLLLIWGLLPLPIGWRIVNSLGVFFIAGSALWHLYDRRKRLSSSTEDIHFLTKKLDLLSARQRYRLPVLLVSGNAARTFFPGDLALSESHIIVSSEALWVYTSETAELPIMYDSMITKWPDMQGRIGVFLAICPEQEDKPGLFIAKLNAFRQSWADTCRIANYSLPVYISTHVGLNSIHYNSTVPLPVSWYQIIKKNVYVLDRYLTPIKNWVNAHQTRIKERKHRLHIQVMLTEVSHWVNQVVLTTLADTHQPIAKCIPIGNVIFPINNEIVPNNLLNAHFVSKTTLSLPNDTTLGTSVMPPDKLIKQMPIVCPFSPLKKMILGMLILTSLFLIGCLLSSYWNNQKLISVIQQDIHYYNVISDTHYAEKAQALEVLKSDRRLINDYFQKGEPLWLSFGLYRGHVMLEPLNQAIGRYVSSPPVPEKIIIHEKEIVIQTSEVIRLDNVSLFETGQSELKPESNKILIDSLMELKTKIHDYKEAGWLVLIAGHTDATGDPIKNQQLSLSRAAAVREWIIRNSDIPETCFATQGYGAKKPLVNNETPQERAKNRRVEISLVPQATSCQ